MKINKEEEDPFSDINSGRSGANTLLAIDSKPMNTSVLSGAIGRDSNLSRGSGTSMGNMMDSYKPDPYSSQPSNMNSNNTNTNPQVKSMMEVTIRDQERMVQSRKEDISAMNNTFASNSELLNTLKER